MFSELSFIGAFGTMRMSRRGNGSAWEAGKNSSVSGIMTCRSQTLRNDLALGNTPRSLSKGSGSK